MDKPPLSLEVGAFWADLNGTNPRYYMAVVVKVARFSPWGAWANVELCQEDFALYQEDGHALRARLTRLRKLYPEPPPDTLRL